MASTGGGAAAGRDAEGLDAFASMARPATSRPASPRDSVITSAADEAGAIATAGAGAEANDRAGGITSAGALSWRGISIGMSTDTGRGRVSKTSGKPITPMTSNTTAPISRRRALVRACWTASPASATEDAAAGSLVRLKIESKPIRCRLPGGGNRRTVAA